jgi:hypothetical protein
MGVVALNLMKETFFYYRATLCKPSETLYLALWDLPLECTGFGMFQSADLVLYLMKVPFTVVR